MQQVAQGVKASLVKDRLLIMAGTRARFERRRTPQLEVMNDVAYGLVGAAIGSGDGGGLGALRGSEQDLGAAQGKGIFGAQRRGKRVLLRRVQARYEEWLSHAQFYQNRYPIPK